MSELFLPLYERQFLAVYQPEYGYEFDEKRFATGFTFRVPTASHYPTVNPIQLIYARVSEAYLETITDFYHDRQLSDDFLVDMTDLALVNPYIRYSSIGKWVFEKPVEINQETFGDNFVDLSIYIKQLI